MAHTTRPLEKNQWGRKEKRSTYRLKICIDVSCRCLVDVYRCFPPMLSATTSKAASIVRAMPTEACSSDTALCEHTLDNRFQVNRQSIGSYYNRRANDACGR